MSCLMGVCKYRFSTRILAIICSMLVFFLSCFGLCSYSFAQNKEEKYIKDLKIFTGARYSSMDQVYFMTDSFGQNKEVASKKNADFEYKIIKDNNGKNQDFNEGTYGDGESSRGKELPVFLGYATTDNANEAITDIATLSMNSAYVQIDYKGVLNNNKKYITDIINRIIPALVCYRKNYQNDIKKKSGKGYIAHEELNRYMDDMGNKLGDVLLNQTKEELGLTDREYNRLDDKKKAKTANLTSIILKGNGRCLASIETALAISGDVKKQGWINRYANKSYSDLVNEYVRKYHISGSSAKKRIEADYKKDVKMIKSSWYNIDSIFGQYKELCKDKHITVFTSEKDLYLKLAKNGKFDEIQKYQFFAGGTVYEYLKKYDETKHAKKKLLDIFEKKVSESSLEREMYVMASVMSDSQKLLVNTSGLFYTMVLGISDKKNYERISDASILLLKTVKPVSVFEGNDTDFIEQKMPMTLRAFEHQIESQTSFASKPSALFKNTFDNNYSVVFGVTALAALNATDMISKSNDILKKKIKYLGVEFVIPNEQIVATIVSNKKSLEEIFEQDKNKCIRQAAVRNTSVFVVLSNHDAKIYATDANERVTSQTPHKPYMYDDIPDRIVDAPEIDVLIDSKFIKKQNFIEYSVVKDQYNKNADLHGFVHPAWLSLYVARDKALNRPVTVDESVNFLVQKGEFTSTTRYDAFVHEFSNEEITNLTKDYKVQKKDDKYIVTGQTKKDGLNGLYILYNREQQKSSNSKKSGIQAIVFAPVGVLVLAAFLIIVFTIKKRKNG